MYIIHNKKKRDCENLSGNSQQAIKNTIYVFTTCIYNNIN